MHAKFEGAGSLLSALYTVTDYPLDLENPVFAHYPAMKFGHRQSVEHYARALAPLARQMILEAPDGGREWVLTSPPQEGLPCGARLICQALHRFLPAMLADGFSVFIDSLSVTRPLRPIANPDEFRRRYEYSGLDFQARQSIWPERDREATYDLEAFRGRNVIFVNDINVTGSQIKAIAAVLRKAGPISLNWLMIVDVAREIGRAHAHLESDINNSGLLSLEDVIAYLRDADYDCTARLVSRLMSHDTGTLAQIFRALDRGRRERLRDAMLTEHAYRGDFFAEKRRLVEQAAQADDRAADRQSIQGEVR